MMLRPALSAFALLLLTGSLASASSTAPAAPPASSANEEVALMTPADGEPGCPADTDELAFLNPAPSARAVGPCGPCSSQNCRGGQIGQGCGFSGGRWYTCQYPYAESCTDGKPKCYCWTGLLP